MAWTRHGHHIPGTVKDDDRPEKVARCGGPRMCPDGRRYIGNYRLQTNSNDKDISVINPIKYKRKTFEVEAVQVTAQNLQEAAKWCGGDVRFENNNLDIDSAYIKVKVRRPLSEKQTRAAVGDWILLSESGYKVYTSRAFESSFVEATDVEQPSGNVFENQPEDDKEELRVVDEPAVKKCDNCGENGELFDVVVDGPAQTAGVCVLCRELFAGEVDGYSADAAAQATKPQPDAIARHEASNLLGGSNE